MLSSFRRFQDSFRGQHGSDRDAGRLPPFSALSRPSPARNSRARSQPHVSVPPPTEGDKSDDDDDTQPLREAQDDWLDEMSLAEPSVGTALWRHALDDEVDDDLEALRASERRQSAVFRGTRALADISTTHEGRKALLKQSATIPQIVQELGATDSTLRHAAEQVLVNLAEDDEGKAARQIAKEIVDLLEEMQEMETAADARTKRETWTPSAASIDTQGHILDACCNLTVLSRNMCLNFEAHNAVRITLPYVDSGFGLARQKALTFLNNLCHWTRMSRMTFIMIDGPTRLWRLLPVLLLTEAACCLFEHPTIPAIREERMHVVSRQRPPLEP